MKKKSIIAIIVLILLFPTFRATFEKLMIPDKVLLVGHQINDYTIDFNKEIVDKERIIEFENLFKEVKFTEDEWNMKTTHPDIITHIRHKNGIATHWFEIWIIAEEGTAVISMSEGTLVGRLARSQVDTLIRIINE